MGRNIELNAEFFEPADIVIHVREKGIVVREKSLVAFDAATGKILAVGTEAEALTGRESDQIRVLSPFRQGVIADYTVAELMFIYLMAKTTGKRPFLRPGVAVCVPKGITGVEKKALEDAILQAGAKEVVISELPMDRFLQEEAERFPDVYRKCRITIGITKEEPERYVEEALDGVLRYAAQEGISTERVLELLQKKCGFH